MQRSAAEVVRSVVERLTATTSRALHAPGQPESEDTLHRLLRNIPGMVFRGGSDPARTMELVSHGSRELTGFGPNELVWGKVVSYGSLIHPDDRRRVHEEISRAVLSGRAYQIEYRIRRVDGRERLVREQGQPIVRDRGGVALEGFVTEIGGVVPRDTSAGTEGMVRVLGEQSPVGVYIINDERFEYVNTRLAEVFGYAESELLGLRSVADIVHPDDRDAVSEHLRLRLEGRADGVPYEFRGRRKDGRDVSVEVIGQRLERSAGPAIAGALLDVTERRKGERRAGEAQKLEAIGRLATGVAHDLNNLLATIKGTAQTLLAERSADSGLAVDLGQIVAAVERGSLLGRQLIDLGRSRPPADATIALGQVISDLEPVLARALGDGIALVLELDDTLPLARIDSIQAEEILTILSINARDSMPHGGVLTIKIMERNAVTFRAGMREGPYVVLEVADTGDGVPSELQSRLFEPSVGLRSPRWPGLARLWRLVHDAGGCVDFESVPTKGSTFRVTLPAAHAH
jgi:PAS domain S-box-containing protein